MLQPRHYPEMLGKALVFDSDPFVTMVEDDNPWVEGLFMVVSMGVLIGLARIVGALLTTAIMPDPDAVLTALLQGWRQIAALMGPGFAAGADVEGWLRQWWPVGTGLAGYGWNWLQLGWIMLAPLGLVLRWLLFGLVAHIVARALGGQGKLTQTLGATALMVAPYALTLLHVIPFVSVSGLLMTVWSILIVYRAVEAVHDLSWGKAAGVALAAPALLFLLVLAGLVVFAVTVAIAGGVA